jgi:hypothetical protein
MFHGDVTCPLLVPFVLFKTVVTSNSLVMKLLYVIQDCGEEVNKVLVN